MKSWAERQISIAVQPAANAPKTAEQSETHLSETLDAFAHAADFVRTLDVSKERLAAAIDGVLPPEKEKHGSLEESLDALRNWNCSITEDNFCQELQKIRETTPA